MLTLQSLRPKGRAARSAQRASRGRTIFTVVAAALLTSGVGVIGSECSQAAPLEIALLPQMARPAAFADANASQVTLYRWDSGWTDRSPHAVRISLRPDPRDSSAGEREVRPIEVSLPALDNAGASLSDLSAAASAQAIVGLASMYNPCEDDRESTDLETASGELYDPIAWTAAIQIDLRGMFNGVRYGRKYRPAYALVESGGKRAIVKVNDVGPLRPGRVIDLNKQTMHYFDPSLQRGLVDVVVTPLSGTAWTPGPLGETPLQMVAENR
ncbi:MAG TPA: septal ring lytic transglycosylase RlpA family protein [Pseudolabrys sp.]|nr:septal ring lytic transglycosylase RlpA family protein [Pseudolabrys sp.]